MCNRATHEQNASFLYESIKFFLMMMIAWIRNCQWQLRCLSAGINKATTTHWKGKPRGDFALDPDCACLPRSPCGLYSLG